MARKDNKGRNLKDGESQRKSDGRYQYRYVDPITSERITIYDMDLSELRKKEREINRLIDEGIITASKDKKASLNTWFERYMEIIQIEDSTRTNYVSLWNNHVRDSLGKMKIADVKVSDIKKFYADMTKKGYSFGTLKVIHGIFVPLFTLAVEDDIVRKNPSTHCLAGFGVKSRVREALTEEEQEKFLKFVSNTPVYKCHLPLILFMIGTACRVGEVIGLTWADIDFKAEEINVDHQLVYKNYGDGCKFHWAEPKTEAGIRVIPMPDIVRHALVEQKKLQFMLGINHDIEAGGIKNFVFTAKTGMPYAPNAINNILYNIREAYNKNEEKIAKKERRKPVLLPKFSAHILRHTGCTRMAEAEVDVKALQYIMGHANADVTMNTYNHISDMSRVKKQTDKINEKFKDVI